MTRLALVTTLLLGGCSALTDGPPANRCVSDAECTTGTCDVALGMCVAAPSARVSVGLEVRPMTEPYGGTVQPIGFAPFEVDGPTERDLELRTGIVVSGEVTDATGAVVSAQLSFTRRSVIPGAPATSIVEESGSAGFTTQLLPATVHELVVTPTGDWVSRLPPLTLAYESPAEGAGRLTVSYPPACEDPAAQETGCLAQFEGRVINRADEGQAGVVVTLVDRLSGRTLSSRYVTASDPELDPGYFTIFFPVELWHAPDRWFLRVAPAAHRTEEVGPSLTFTKTAESLASGPDGMIMILAPEREALRLTYSGTVETADGRPLADAAISFSSSDITDPVTNIVGSYSTSTRTDENGHFSVDLLGRIPEEYMDVEPATYDIVVTPSQHETELGVLRQETRLRRDASGQLLTVPARARFGGTVQTIAGERMVDARVVAQPRNSDNDGLLGSVAFLARSNQTTTDAMGLFDLRLDVGLYDVVIEPPAGTNFPWRIQRDVAIGGSSAPLTSVYELDHPVPITGTATWLVDGERQPVAEGEVRAYAIVETERGQRAILVGRATTDAMGRYTVLLPPSL